MGFTNDADCADYSAICGWLDNPRAGAGIRLADEEDGWISRPYAELAVGAHRVAGLLNGAGVRPGDRVCVLLPSDFACVEAIFGTWAGGATVTLVAPPVFGGGADYTTHLAAILEVAAPRIVVTNAELAPLVRGVLDESSLPGELFVLSDTTAEHEIEQASQRPAAQPSDCALIQFTSGSSGVPKGVRITWKNLHANTSFCRDSVGWRPGETTVSWLPLYHDMGLIGALIANVANQGELYLMRPDQFIREPARWLRALASAQHAGSPSFGLGYVARRVRRADIADLDLSGLRSLMIGAEPLGTDEVRAFTELLDGTGYDPACLRPGYGLAESTLLAATSPMGRFPTAVRVDGTSLRFGHSVTVDEVAEYRGQALTGSGWLVGHGGSTAEATIRIVDAEGLSLPDGVLGEVVISGDSVAAGYLHAPDSDPGVGTTRFTDGELASGDAGFLRDGELFVLGRMGSSIKVRGRSVFMEDLDTKVARETGLPKQKFAAVAMYDAAATSGIVLFAECEPGEWMGAARRVLRAELGPAQHVTVVTGGRGLIRRTSSGKPRRRHMWERFRDAGLDGEIAVHDTELAVANATEAGIPDRRPSTALLSDVEITELLDRALDVIDVPAESTFLLEGSIAEGFGNDGSDIDFLVVIPGADPTPEMPTVLFVGGRRVEVRTRTESQLRAQLEYAQKALRDEHLTAAGLLDLNQDILNRCQRFLRAAVVRPGVPDVNEIRDLLPAEDLSRLLGFWWRARGLQSLRQAVAMSSLREAEEALDWARDGLLQVIKGWAAGRGETYLESKWLGPQLERIGDEDITARYFALAGESARQEPDGGSLTEILAFSTELGLDADVVDDDADRIVVSRVSGVTSWPIDGRVHVLRDDTDVFVLSDRAARAWRSVVFGRSLRELARRWPEPLHTEMAEFIRLGFVGIRWGRATPIRPAIAMVKPSGAYTCPPDAVSPILGIGGGVRAPGRIATLSALPARRFTECASGLIWANVIIENAREDLIGALRQRQWRVADAAADRLMKGVARLLLSALGCGPVPADIAPLTTLDRLMPDTVPRRAAILVLLRSARDTSFADLGGAGEKARLAVLDALVDAVRGTAELSFPASFDSQDQWLRTMDITYDWLRLAAYLNTELPLDEAQDLLASGGAQPHVRGASAEGRTVR